MIEPYSRDIHKGCILKRYHKVIFEMWYAGETVVNIHKKLLEMGVKIKYKPVINYINRCFEEEGLPHDYSLPKLKPGPENDGRCKSICRANHEKIAYLRNYMGYTAAEIAKEIGVHKHTVTRYIIRCLNEGY